MAERRFTRLKASLSETAAKTRENVSRELRQSLVADSESVVHCIDDKYECCVRRLEKECDFVSFPQNDIKCHSIESDDTTHRCPKDTPIRSSFSRECVKHLSADKHVIAFTFDRFFGSVFECFDPKCGSDLKPHVFESDQSVDEKAVVRESSCVMNRMNGWLTLTTAQHEDDYCFLSFFRDRKRTQLIWGPQEVTQEVVKCEQNSFQIDCHSIEMNAEVIDEWVKDINTKRFDAKRRLQRIQSSCTVEHLKRFQTEHRINLFSTYVDLNVKKGIFAHLRETPNTCDSTPNPKSVFKFVVCVQKLELNNALNAKSIESFFAKISLFDSSFGKISEEFRIDFCSDVCGRTPRDSGRGFDEQWISRANKAVFCVDLNDSKANDLFLVLRIDKSPHRVTQHIDHFEPFLWSARPVFKADCQSLETSANFGSLYKLDTNRLSDDFVTNCLSNQNILKNNTSVSGKLLIRVQDFDIDSESQIDSTLFPLTKVNFDKSPEIHVQNTRLLAQPIRDFRHVLYVLPQSLKYDSQKLFSKARNIAVSVQLFDSDSPNASPLPLIFGRPNDRSMFVDSSVTPIIRHNVCPDFYEEVKVGLPLHFSDKLHLRFTFFHISCKKECTRTIIGFSWLSLHKHIHCQNGALSLSVFASLPDGYLSCQSLGLGKGLSMPDVKFVGKDLFKVSLKLVSTLMSRDVSLETTLENVTQITANRGIHDSREVSKLVALERSLKSKHLKSLLLCDLTELVRFAQILFQQLFRLFVYSANNDLICDTLHTIVQLVDRLRDRADILCEFVDHTFKTCHFGDVLFHEQLIKSLNEVLETVDRNEDESRVLLRHIWFLLRIHIKACVQHLFASHLIQTNRENRFPLSVVLQMRRMVDTVSALIVTHSRLEESSVANRALSHYLCRLMSFFDRSFVFNSFFAHLNAFTTRDVVLSEMRLQSLAIMLSHEHHIPLNNPVENESFALSLDFCEKHFLIYVLFNEFKHSLSQSVRHVRQLSLQILRNLLAKHAFDPRYSSDSELFCRVISLYLPAIDIIIENMNRLIDCNESLKRRSLNRQVTEDKWSSESRPEHHIRHNSLPVRFDAFNSDEIKDIIICFAFVLSHATERQVQTLSAERLERLLVVMETALFCFKYKADNKSSELRAKTLPNAITRDANDLMHYLCRQNLSIQISLIALRTITLCLNCELQLRTTERVLSQCCHLFLALLSLTQSQHILQHVFDTIRYFAATFPDHFFASNHTLLPQIIAKIIHFCDSSLKPIRDSGVDLLYSLFALNFKRTRFEAIVCVSRLASNDCKPLSHFQSSLNRIESLSESDDTFAKDNRLSQTVQRIRDILKATHRIRTESRNCYDNCELRLFLANSYSQTSWSLRRTWIENLAEVHGQNNDWAECAMCQTAVIAIVIQQLRTKGVSLTDEINHLSRTLCRVSPNIAEDEIRGETDSDWLESEDSSHVTIASLETLIDECVEALEKADLFELATHVIKVMVDYYEREFDHKKLAAVYQRISRMHSLALEANNSGKRLFDTYFRVAFFGSQNNEFIYKESKVVSLSEMTSKLRCLYPKATILSDCSDGASRESAIVVTHVTPFALEARNDFERNTGINRFVYEQRVETEKRTEHSVAQQHKKRVILKTSNWFPFCLKRITVVDKEETILSPIQVAIDEMRDKVGQLERVIQSNDVKMIQLVLQGSVSATVNCGPIAYKNAFLSNNENDEQCISHFDEKEEELRQLFERFLDLCERALKANERLIKANQTEYHLSLKTGFERLKSELNLHEDKRTSVQIFDVISGSSVA